MFLINLSSKTCRYEPKNHWVYRKEFYIDRVTDVGFMNPIDRRCHVQTVWLRPESWFCLLAIEDIFLLSMFA